MTTPGSNTPGEQPPGGPAGWGQPAGSPQPPAAAPQPPQGPPSPGSYPPPQGPVPPGQFPQGQVPQGQFPQGQYPPQQPGQPGQYPPPQGQFAQGQPWNQPTPPARSSGKIVAIGGAVLAVLVVAVLALAFLGGGNPEAGDCLKEDGQELAVVDCDDSEAAYRLIGIQDGQQSYDEFQADPNTCQAFPESTQYFWVGENGDTTGQGDVYCVTTV